MAESPLNSSRIPVYMDREQRRKVLEKAERLIGLRKIKGITNRERMKAARMSNDTYARDQEYMMTKIAEDAYTDDLSNDSGNTGTMEDEPPYLSLDQVSNECNFKVLGI